jgi:2-dehydropantoate 2-reductase
MRYIIYGAGAIGGAIGARLFQHGQDVVLIARGAHLQAMLQRGLVVESPVETVTLPISTVGHPSEIRFRDGDVVFLCMKSQHTLQALEDLRKTAGEGVPVICCQNGVSNERSALRRFEHVYAMLVIVPATHLEPGVVQINAKGKSGILEAGIFPAGTDKLVEEVTAALEASSFNARPDPATMRTKYTKLLNNLDNSLQAACDAGEAARDISKLMHDEALACYRAAGIDWVPMEVYRERYTPLLQIAMLHGESRFGGSSWQSIVRGTGSIEADHLNGEIVQLGRLHGVPTPANQVLQGLANELAREGGNPGSVPLDEVRARIERTSRG